MVGWNTSDVTAGAVYQVIQSDGVAVMLDRADGLGTFASLLFVCGLGLWVTEWISRKRTGSGPGTLSSYLGQSGGIRDSDFVAVILSFVGQRSFPDSENKTCQLTTLPAVFSPDRLGHDAAGLDVHDGIYPQFLCFRGCLWNGHFLAPWCLSRFGCGRVGHRHSSIVETCRPYSLGPFTNAFDSDFDSHRDEMTRWDALKEPRRALCLVFMGSLVAWLSGAFVVTWVMSWLVLITAEALLILQSRGEASGYHYLTQAGVKPQTQVEEENDDNRF